MKKVLIVFLSLALVLSLAACGGNSAGIKDGMISLDDVTLTFGDNEVPASSKAKLTAVKEENSPDGLASPLYTLDLDWNCTSSVTITAPIDNDNIPEDKYAVPMLGLGNELLLPDGSTTVIYSYISAQVDGDNVTASFIPADYLEQISVHGAAGAAEASKERLRLGIFWCSTTFADGGHFIVYFPAKSGSLFIDYNDRSALLSDLEGVYNDYLNKGYKYAKRVTWPMEVNIQSMSDMGYYSYGWNGAEGKIYINRNLLEGGYQAGKVTPLLAHEFFHFVQLNYVESGSDNIWFDEATATYFEGQKSGGIPNIVDEYNEKIFNGVFPEENDAANGYARMPLIKYLSQRLGENFILNAYTIAGSGSEWDSALLSSTGPMANWSADFYEALVKGEVSNYAPYTLHTNLAAGERAEIGTALALSVPTEDELLAITENDEIPLLGETSLNIGAYGAKLAALTIDDTQLSRLKEGTDPVVSVSDGADLRMFAIRGNKFNVLKSSGSSVKLDDFKKLCEDKYLFLALVTGLHDSGNQDYTLKVEFSPYPTLDELVGEYADGGLTFTDIYIPPEVKTEVAAEEDVDEDEDDDIGCDINIDILEYLESLEGTEQKRKLLITKTGENTGTMLLIDEEDEESDSTNALPFTYANGLLIFDYSYDNMKLTGNLVAAYGKNKDVTVRGDLRMEEISMDIRIDILLTGSKPLTGEQ